MSSRAVARRHTSPQQNQGEPVSRLYLESLDRWESSEHFFWREGINDSVESCAYMLCTCLCRLVCAMWNTFFWVKATVLKHVLTCYVLVCTVFAHFYKLDVFFVLFCINQKGSRRAAYPRWACENNLRRSQKVGPVGDPALTEREYPTPLLAATRRIFVFVFSFPDSAISPPILMSCSSHTEACNALGTTDGLTSHC